MLTRIFHSNPKLNPSNTSLAGPRTIKFRHLNTISFANKCTDHVYGAFDVLLDDRERLELPSVSHLDKHLPQKF